MIDQGESIQLAKYIDSLDTQSKDLVSFFINSQEFK